MSTGDAVAESGLEFWLFGTPLGGWGNEPTLMVLRRLFAGVIVVAGDIPLTGLGVGKPDAEPFCGLA